MSTQMITADLIAALEAKIPEATRYDREQLKAHRKTCKESAAARRVYLRELIALPDNELAEHKNLYRAMPDASSCPLSKASQFDNALAWLKRDRRKTMTINSDDMYGRLLMWTATPTSATVCVDD